MDLSWLQLPSSLAGRGRRSVYLVGVVSGITLSLGSLATALLLANVRARRRRRRRLARFKAQGRTSSSGKSGDNGRSGRVQGSGDGDVLDSGRRRRRAGNIIDIRAGQVVRGVDGLIGNTPLMRIESLSELTGCEILGKAEFLNPGGSPKDRVAKQILDDAEDEGWLHPNTGSCIFEGTVGSTGISLATLSRARGYRCSIVIPDDVSREKAELLRKLGAEIDAVRPRGIVDPRHFVNEARARAEAFGTTELVGPHPHTFEAQEAHAPTESFDGGEKRDDLVVTTNAHAHRSGADAPHEDDADDLEMKPRGFFADQFENVSNFYAHYHGTGPEIWRQTGGMLDAFVAGAGTGGTLSGVAVYLQQQVAEANASDSSGSDDGDSDSDAGIFTSWLRFGPRRSVPRRWTASENEVKPWEVKEGADGQEGSSALEWPGQREEERRIEIVLADPQGSGLYNKVKYGVMFNQTEAEGKRRRHQVDTVVEGIGLNRLTKNFEMGLDCFDAAERVTDEEAVRMSRHLVLKDGLFLGSSSAVNCVAAVRTALRLKRQHVKGGGEPPVVVTILCDSGTRHLSKFWDDDAVRKLGIDPSQSDISDILAEEPSD